MSPDPWPDRENLPAWCPLRFIRAVMRFLTVGHGVEAVGFAALDARAAMCACFAGSALACYYAVHLSDVLARDAKRGGMRETR